MDVLSVMTRLVITVYITSAAKQTEHRKLSYALCVLYVKVYQINPWLLRC